MSEETTTFIVTMTFEVDVPARADWESQRSAIYTEGKDLAFRRLENWHETGIDVVPSNPLKRSRQQRYRELMAQKRAEEEAEEK